MIDKVRQRMEALQGRVEKFSEYFIEWLERLVDDHNANATAIAANTAAIAANASAIAALAAAGVKPGFVQVFAGAATPAGWLACDGSAVSRATYAALFTAIGITWGAGDGATTFNLPDVRGRTIIGVGAGVGLTARALADLVGEESHQLTTPELPAHSHGPGTLSGDAGGAHTHGLSQIVTSVAGAANGIGPLSAVASRTAGTATTDSGGSHAHTVSGATATTGADGAHNNMQPGAAFLICVKT